MRIVAISDTHTHHRKLVIPDGDVLVHAGDVTSDGEIETIVDFADWFRALPHKHKLIVPGNHDFCFDISHARYNSFAERLIDATGAHYLIDASRTIGGKKFYGAPWVPYLELWAFWDRNRDRFESAPRDIDVLVTHGPPRGIRDSNVMNTHFGSTHLVRYINHCWNLRLHVFGHVHDGYGRSPDSDPIIFANASSCNREYEPVNAPLVIDI